MISVGSILSIPLNGFLDSGLYVKASNPWFTFNSIEWILEQRQQFEKQVSDLSFQFH